MPNFLVIIIGRAFEKAVYFYVFHMPDFLQGTDVTFCASETIYINVQAVRKGGCGKEKSMKKKAKMLICTMTAAMELLAAVPFSAFALQFTEKPQKESWYKDENGKIFYYDENLKAVTGEQTVDNQPYLFSENGAMKTGWRTIDGKRFYFSAETGENLTGWIDYCGKKYYVDAKNGKQTGIVSADSKLYMLDEFGSLSDKTGLVKLDDSFRYLTEGGIVATDNVDIDGVKYAVSADGIVGTSWQTIDGKKFYFEPETCTPVFGLKKIGNGYYMITKDYGVLTGEQTLSGVPYLFGTDGMLLTGWQTTGGAKRFYNEDATLAKGFVKIGDSYYFLAENGAVNTGWQQPEGLYRYFNADGTMAVGLTALETGTYFFNENGVALGGWQTVDGNNYYFGSDGKALTGIQTVGDKTYDFGKDGIAKEIIQSGWVTSDGNTYYYGKDGKALTGRQLIDGKYYLFNTDGVMFINFWIDGEMGKYYFGSDGVMATGWQTIGEYRYHFDETTGVMSVNTTIDGWRIFNDGTAAKISAVQLRAQSILSTLPDKNIYTIYNWVRNHNTYKYMEATRTLAQINALGWGYFANYAMDYRYIVCYYYAAVLDILLKEAGYQTRIVYGTGRGAGDHYWNQVYSTTDGIWYNWDACNGYAAVYDSYLVSQNYTWYDYVYPRYYEVS